jgi:hypothetical protein
MFGAMSYNKPNLDYDSDQVAQGQGQSYNEFYNKAEQDWPGTMSDLALLFRANLGNILGISGRGGMMSDGTTYYNTFWAINNKIIPSSLIIEELLYSVQSLSTTSLVTFRVNLTETKEAPVWNKPTNFSDLVMANRWKIEYETCFNMSRLLEAAAMKN